MVYRDLHASFAWYVLISNGIAGAWALTAHKVEALRSRWLWWFTGAAEIGLMIQVVLGVLAMRIDGVEASGIHTFYGFFAMAAVAIIYSYRQQLEHWTYLLYGWGGLFLMGMAIREFFLAGA